MKKFLLYLAIFLLLVPLLVSAQMRRGGLNLQEVVDFIDTVANWLYVIGFALAIIVVIWGGIMYMTSAGDDEKQRKAKGTIVAGLIGAGIILLAGVIIDTVVGFLD